MPWACILACAALLYSSPSLSAWHSVYDWRIKKAARHYLPYEPWLLYKAQLIQESSLNPKAQSAVGAKGIAQFMPQTWIETTQALGFHGQPTDVRLAIPAGAYYMAKLRYVWHWPRPETDRYNLALACYNVGCGWILKAQKACGDPSLYQPIMACLPKVMKDPNETLHYAPKIRQIYEELSRE
ncbi:transglycosylase-like protein with SLT domain [Celerinatantimonas diazotrophica]|uniref:Transglycosylase-like protein with SLT domain n=1 Tax=Celerinatantimonas diazotrophica TaxID=412034 RepID=A0A4R1K4C7_9GAMM|nr:transglycosylase-like protein with SLT domain [Celerinatantimonas diazotrophica]